MSDPTQQPDTPDGAPPPFGSSPQYGQPQYGQPQYGQPAPGQPAYSQPQYGPPQYGQPAPNAPMYGPPTGAALSPADERLWGMLAHLLTLIVAVLSSGFLGFVAALVIYLVYKDRSAYVRRHAANALNVQIAVLIGAVISFVLMFVLIGFLTIAAVGIWALVIHIMGAVKANNGELWDPPLTPRLVS